MFKFGSTIDGGVGTAVMDWAGGVKVSMKGNPAGGVVTVPEFGTIGCWGWAGGGGGGGGACACVGACANGMGVFICGSASGKAIVDSASVGSRGLVSEPRGY